MALFQGQKPVGSGSLMIGSKGTLYSPSDYGGEYRLLPVANFKEYQPPQPKHVLKVNDPVPAAVSSSRIALVSRVRALPDSVPRATNVLPLEYSAVVAPVV